MANWVLTTEVVRRAIGQLRAQSIHEFFPAYLHLRQQSAVQGTEDAIEPRWNKELAPLLEVTGAPAGHPYFRPFTGTQGAHDGEWLNKNLAGSYAPGSLRQVPKMVVEVVGSGRKARFKLKQKHWELARTHLLNEVRPSLWALAAFLLRDYAWLDYEQQPGYAELEGGFIYAFGYEGDSGAAELDHLFDRTPLQDIEVWFEPVSASE